MLNNPMTLPANDKHLARNILIYILGFRGFLKWTSDLGGLTGIWLGASIVSLVELLELLVDIIMIVLKGPPR